MVGSVKAKALVLVLLNCCEIRGQNDMMILSTFLIRSTSQVNTYRSIAVYRRDIRINEYRCICENKYVALKRFHMLEQEGWALKNIPTLNHLQGMFDCEFDATQCMNQYRSPDGLGIINTRTKAYTHAFLQARKTSEKLPSGVMIDPYLKNRFQFCVAPVFGNVPLIRQWVWYHTAYYASNITFYAHRPLLPTIVDFLASFENVRIVPWYLPGLRTGDVKFNSNISLHNVSYYGQYSALSDCILRSSGAKYIKFSDLDEFLVKAEDVPIDDMVIQNFHNRLVRYGVCASQCLTENGIVANTTCTEYAGAPEPETIHDGHLASHMLPYYPSWRHHSPQPFKHNSRIMSLHLKENYRVQQQCQKQSPNHVEALFDKIETASRAHREQ